MMEKATVFQNGQESTPVEGKLPGHTPSLVVGILSIVLGLIIALVGDVLAIVGIVMAVSKRKTHRTRAALVCSLIGLAVSVGNHVLSYWLLTQMGF